jgi:hypothetical protein
MVAILYLLAMFVADLFRSRRRLQAENFFLRHQLNIALKRAPRRPRLCGSDRALSVGITRIWPSLLDISQVVDHSAMASVGLQSVLAMEIPKEGRAAEGRS